jgi:hypothetical protein
MTKLGRAGFTLICSCIGLAIAASARAEQTQTVWLVLPDCATPPYDPSELSRSLDVELAPYHLRAQVRTADSTEPGTSVRVGLPRCDADGPWLTLQYGDAVGRRSRKRALSLRDVPRPARARMLALVIAYALRPARSGDDPDASVPAPAPHDEPRRLEPLAPAPADPVRVDTPNDLPIRNFPFPLRPAGDLPTRDSPFDADPAADTKWRRALPGALRLGAGLEFRLLTGSSSLLFGVELNLRGHLLGRSEWALEAVHSEGNTDASELDWWKAGVGVDYPLTAAPCLRLGPRLTLARVEGTGASPSATSLLSAGGRASFSARILQRANLDVQFQLDHSSYVEPWTADTPSLPWYGWVLTWGAGLSLDI